MDILKEILERKLVVIARRIPLDKIENCVKAVIEGGVTLMESTFDQQDKDCIKNNALCIEKMVKASGGKALIGAGTVLTAEQVRAAYDAGAKYIISPNTNEEVIRETKKLGLISIPGAMSPTEVVNAYNMGADIVKIFPADDMGIHYIQNLMGPLGHIPYMATGGVNPDTIPQFYKAGAKAFGTGITILKPDYVQSANYEGIKELAKKHMDAVRALGEDK